MAYNENRNKCQYNVMSWNNIIWKCENKWRQYINNNNENIMA